MKARRLLRGLGRPSALAGCGLLALGGGVVANALLLQEGRHPAPFFATPEPAEHAAGVADPLVRDIQAALAGVGRYSGAVDGVAGPQTRAAIIDFERSAGSPPTGRASAALLAAIRAATPTAYAPALQAAPSAEAAAVPPTPPTDPQVALIQRALADAAYGPIRADGVAGAQTRDAISRFEADHGLPVTGQISDELVLQLRAAGVLQGE